MPSASALPTPAYYAYIDEAGDTGINRVAPIDDRGGSEWLVLSGVVIRAENEARCVRIVRDFKEEIGSIQRPDLHYRHLTAARKLTVCQKLAEQELRCFVMLSNKKNMRSGSVCLNRLAVWISGSPLVDHAAARSGWSKYIWSGVRPPCAECGLTAL